MAKKYFNKKEWYAWNLTLLTKFYWDKKVDYDTQCFTWLRINRWGLPPNWQPGHSTLLIRLSTEIELPPTDFYLEMGLTTTEGYRPGHYFDSSGYNDLSHLNYARYCLHIKEWQPTPYVIRGDNWLTAVKCIYDAMASNKPMR